MSQRPADASFQSLGVQPPKRTYVDSRVRAPPTLAGASANDTTKSLVLSEHKVELVDMLQEMVSQLKNVYRSKFVFGDHLRYVDPSYGGDAVGHFNLTTPPSFDPSYTTPAQEHVGRSGAFGFGDEEGGGGGASKEKLRTAEELIKKLYRRNTQLEVENKYLKNELARVERFGGVSRTDPKTSIVDGHLPMEHPLYTRNTRRRCRSGPPSRTLLRAAINGVGLAFPPRAGTLGEEAPQKVEDPLPVQHLKKQVVMLTEALVTVQHENEKLSAEKRDRVSLRDTLLRNYVVERDSHIAQLHSTLQDMLSKVHNPMRLVRSKQPSNTINPVVAANNLLREVSTKLTEQITQVTSNIILQSKSATSPSDPASGGTVEVNLVRRKELANRVQAIVDGLPVQKKKALLLMMMELKQIFEALVQSNRSLLGTYEDLKAKTNKDAIQLKLNAAVLKDQLRSLGVKDTMDETSKCFQNPVPAANNSPRGGRTGGKAGDPM